MALLTLAIILLKKQGLLYWYTGFLAALVIILIELLVYKISKLTMANNRDNLG